MFTVAKNHAYQEEIKKSRFIASVASVASVQDALAFVEKRHDPDASHNCWAYKVGTSYRFSDDGEPGGTAGRPIFGAIERKGLDRVAVVVSRFFGGIKLGAGGLARAYGGTAATCLRLAKKLEIKKQVAAEFSVPFEFVGSLFPLLQQVNASQITKDYTPEGVGFRVHVDSDQVDRLKDALLRCSHGSIQIEIVEESKKQEF
jgi:uncharacterized YigZ family protein